MGSSAVSFRPAAGIGGEWDWNWSGLKEDTSLTYLDSLENFYRIDHFTHKQVDWFSTARARVGLAWDRILVYGTAGLAYASYDAYTNITWGVNEPNNTYYYNGGYHQNRFGWVAGGGIEWAFANNWTAKAEFLYLDFGSFDYRSPVDFLDEGVSYDDWHTHVDAKEYVARIGLNYLFHTGGAPVVARY